MSSKHLLPLLIIACLPGFIYGQCNTLRSQIDITFNTDQDCAPTSVTEFTITYYFNTPQVPGDIEILFEWNNPTNATTVVDMRSGLIVGAGNTEFTANATFTYPEDDNCSFLPTAYIIIDGAICPTSEQVQTAFSWARDNEFGGVLAITPEYYDVCYGDAINNAVFQDNSFFNCNPVAEPDNPNRQQRHVQFVYGTNHNSANSIRDLSLNDGATQNLTDGTGALAATDTRGTPGQLVTAAYFGPVDAIPFPADGPISSAFPTSAPANPANAVGNIFEITMYNWNICNPYNGDPLNPNYENAISTTAYVRIIDAPVPGFVTREDDAAGAITTDFCIDDLIYFDNLSTNGDSYSWEFFDDNTGTVSIGSSSQSNPTFSYSTSGPKLIRLMASNTTAQGACTETMDVIVNITPALSAQLETQDLGGNVITPRFCQDPSLSQTFNVRFVDVSTGFVTPTTQWRWEFYNENGSLIREEPGPGFSSSPLGAFDISFTNLGVYTTRLIISDAVTSCENITETEVFVYEGPVADFSFNRVCEGDSPHFTDNSTLNSINGESIISREWDFDYDGVTFNKDPAFDNQLDFDRSLGGAGSYDVALRVTTDQNNCIDIVVKTVIVDPLPIANISADNLSGCSVSTVNFTNLGAGSQPDVISQYIWEIDEGSGYMVDSIQVPSDPSFSPVYTKSFQNLTLSDKVFDVRLRAITQNSCETVSAPLTITVLPGPRSGFITTNYSPFDDNCSPVPVDFEVDAETQSLNPASYHWEIEDANGIVHTENTGTNPGFTYIFENNIQTVKDFNVTLTATLPNGCFGDSTRMIRINPVPDASVSLDTLQLDCETMQMNIEADQKGLSQYDWTVLENGVETFTTSTAGDNFDYTVAKGASDVGVEIKLQTTNFANCQSPEAVTIYTVPQAQVINASFTVNPMSQTLPASIVTINNTTNSGPWDYLWDFGDGTTSTNSNPTDHTYETYGTYTITLTASFEECIETATQTVTISPIPPIVDFSYNPASGCAPLTVDFTNLSQYADENSYYWQFGDGNTSREINPRHTYFQPGIYSVSLSASNALQDTVQETKSMIIEVYESPIAGFEIRPFVVLVPDNPIYTSNRSLSANSFLWDFGDGTESTDPEPIHYYQEEGLYTITLVAANHYNCTDTVTREGVVQAKSVGRVLIPNAFSPSLSGPSGSDVGTGGTNDIFLPITQQVKEFEMLVFNRWGELLFHSDNQNLGWNGYYQGKLCPQDVYVYRMDVVFENGETLTKTGDVNLIR